MAFVAQLSITIVHSSVKAAFTRTCVSANSEILRTDITAKAKGLF